MYAFDFNLQYDPATSPSQFLTDKQAISSWIRVALCSTPASNSRIFDDNTGTSLMSYLHEPIDALTASSIRASIISNLPSLDPRITVEPSGITVTPNPGNQTYLVDIRGVLSFNSSQEVAARFLLTRNA